MEIVSDCLEKRLIFVKNYKLLLTIATFDLLWSGNYLERLIEVHSWKCRWQIQESEEHLKKVVVKQIEYTFLLTQFIFSCLRLKVSQELEEKDNETSQLKERVGDLQRRYDRRISSSHFMCDIQRLLHWLHCAITKAVIFIGSRKRKALSKIQNSPKFSSKPTTAGHGIE